MLVIGCAILAICLYSLQIGEIASAFKGSPLVATSVHLLRITSRKLLEIICSYLFLDKLDFNVSTCINF
jgi:hypothetical protein